MKRKSKKPPLRQEYQSLIDTLYLIKLNRIGRNFTLPELSFLIGRPSNYMVSKENLSVGYLTTKDLYWIAASFHLPATLLFMKNPLQHNKIKVRVFTVKQQGIIIHIAEKQDECNAPELLFKLYEFKAPPTKKEKEKDEQQLTPLIETIDNLLQQGYFNKDRMPLEIYEHCSRITTTYIRPYLLEEALTSHCNLNKNPCLKRDLHKTEGYVYKKYTGKSSLN